MTESEQELIVIATLDAVAVSSIKSTDSGHLGLSAWVTFGRQFGPIERLAGSSSVGNVQKERCCSWSG